MALPELVINSPTPGTPPIITTLAANVVTTPVAGTVETWTFTGAPPAGLAQAGQWRFVIGSEVCIDVTGAGGTARQIQRGAEGSAIATHAIGDNIVHYLTAGALQNLIAANQGVNTTCSARRTASLTITAGATAKVGMDTVDFDPGSNYDTGGTRYVCPVAGRYQVNSQVMLAAVAGQLPYGHLQVYKNGSVYKSGNMIAGGSGSYLCIVQSTLIDCNAGDYIEVYLTNNAGASFSLQLGSDVNYIQVALFTGAAGTPPSSGLQNGVVASGDGAVSAVSVTGGSGAITFTLAAANPLWVISSTTGLIVPVNLAAHVGSSLTPGGLPAAGKYRGYGLEVDANGAVTLSTGGTDQTTQALALTNINTIPANGKLRLADVIVLNTAGVYSLSATRDRRPWARGAYNRITRTANAAAGSDYVLSTLNASTVIDATNLAVRMECSGVPVRLTLRGQAYNTNGGGAWCAFGFQMDGAAVDGAANPYSDSSPGASYNFPLELIWDTVPAAGSHLFVPTYQTSAGNLHAVAAAAAPLLFTVEELVRANANNGTA